MPVAFARAVDQELGDGGPPIIRLKGHQSVMNPSPRPMVLAPCPLAGAESACGTELLLAESLADGVAS
jgi:hypothetical protein